MATLLLVTTDAALAEVVEASRDDHSLRVVADHREAAAVLADAQDVVLTDCLEAVPELRAVAPTSSLVWVGPDDAPGVDDAIRVEDVPSQLPRVVRYAAARTAYRLDLREANEQFARWALHDPLTDVLNRRGLEAALRRESATASRGAGNLAALLVDCDDFKSINDEAGHASGDQVLKAISAILLSTVRSNDYVARVGGDEFLLLLPGTRTYEAVEVGERIRQRVANGGGRMPDLVSTSVSIGVRSVPTGISRVSDLLLATQAALKSAKDQGKNKVVLLHGAQDGDAVERRPSEPWLLHLGTSAVFGWEAPIPEHPGDVFNERLKRAAMPHLDLEAFRDAVAACPEGDHQCHAPLLPATLLRVPRDQLLEQLPGHVPPERLRIRLDEQFLCGDPSALVAPLVSLGLRGVQTVIEVSDFGKTCLESVVLLDPGQVRIAPERVRGVAKRIGARSTLERFVRVCASLGVEVVAAGLDDPEDVNVVRAMGVHYGNGHALSLL